MRVTPCLYNSRTALYRVFISPFEKADVLSRRSAALFIPAVRVLPTVPAVSTSIFSRHASLVPRFKKRDNNNTPSTSSKATLPTDKDIEDQIVMVVNEEGKLDGPYRTRNVLSSLDPETETLRMVSRAPREPAEGQPQFAICKIINKRDEKEKERAMEKSRKEQSRKATRIKELEINWAIAPNDLQHKLRQMKTFLQKGFKVDVLLAKKKGSRVANRDEADALVQAIRDAKSEVRGAKEWKEPDGKPLKVLKLYFSGSTSSGSSGGARSEAPEPTEEEAPVEEEALDAEEPLSSETSPRP
ncbi:Translation initiation factor IF-3 [Colletotrichum musicola]|uniref:Translation initiation factor IF-3 n=1 Tax=Colletotrichum musicola TaxID=2175873 RepID=A0A8H6K4A0_9PEZI|nr:Translation initiation factor IF-3 [Colletotrichum musicola]